MIEVFGHARARAALERPLPPVTLLRGPASVGKWTLGEYAIQYHNILPVDVLRYDLPESTAASPYPSALTAEAVRAILRFAATAPFGRQKVVLVRLDRASESSLNALLKLLEEPPPTIRFLLTTVRPTLVTVTSRSFVVPVGLLTREDLFDVLTRRLGMSPSAADKAAELGKGQVAAALTADAQDNARAAVLSVLKAVADGDPALLEQATTGRRRGADGTPGGPKWAEPETEMLNRWVVEAITGRWSAFTEAETFGLSRDPNLPRRMLVALTQGARPKLAVRVALAPIVASRVGRGPTP